MDVGAEAVLVVEDETAIRAVVSEFLELAGFVVETARHGAEALAKVRASAFAAIVLDLMMPVMSGWDFLDACGDELVAARIPVVVVSAAYAPSDVARRPPVRAVLTKPFDLDVLESIVRQVTSSRARLRAL
jgi:CheY-like chemotaxis protein